MKENGIIRVCIYLLLTVAVPASAEQLAFDEDSLAEIEQHYAGERFLLNLWSVDCPPCRDELEIFSRLQQEDPDINLILVATDGPDLHAEAIAVLREFQLDGIVSWMYADANAERLRYSIDREWFGELPRSYFYAADSSRIAVSGVLDEARIRGWLVPSEF